MNRRKFSGKKRYHLSHGGYVHEERHWIYSQHSMNYLRSPAGGGPEVMMMEDAIENLDYPTALCQNCAKEKLSPMFRLAVSSNALRLLH